MMRSLFSGVAGLRTHQTKMDVIGNNIANVNTTGYKSQSVTFRDLMYQTTQSASGANAETGLGGTNAKQIGLGVTTGAINTAIAQQGSAQTTNNPFDIMISGDNFFVVSNGTSNLFTRDGSFYVDGMGNLAMTSTGYKVMGWQVDPATGAPKKDTVSALKVMEDSIMTYPPDGTSEGRVTGIVDKNDKNVHTTSGRIMNFEFYDNAGYLYTARFSVHAQDTEKGEYYIALDDIRDSTGTSIGTDAMNSVNFGSTITVNPGTSYSPTAGKATAVAGKVNLTFTPTVGTPPVTLAPDVNTPINTALEPNLKTVYGITAADGNIQSYQVNEYGQITVTMTDGSVSTFQKPDSVAIDYTDLDITVPTEGGDVIIDGGGPKAVPGDMTHEQLQNIYGIDAVTAGRIQLVEVAPDGSITVTQMRVDHAANLLFNPGNGQFDSIAGNGQGLITLGLSGVGTAGRFKDINLNFSTCSNVNNNGSSTISSAKGDKDGLGSGRARGEMISLSVAQDGIITAAYDNGMSRCLGQIATAAFANPSGLEKVGDNLYQATRNSGDFDGIGKDITDGGGKMQSGVLEMSNVDLSQEFTEMITTQRGFQANSRIITVSDTMLEELTNLKR